MIRELDRSLALCLDSTAHLEAVEYYDGICTAGTRGDRSTAA
jgi:hypothetical protein